MSQIWLVILYHDVGNQEGLFLSDSEKYLCSVVQKIMFRADNFYDKPTQWNFFRLKIIQTYTLRHKNI